MIDTDGERIHPIIIVSGGDIVRILKEKGVNSRKALVAWLDVLGDESNAKYR
jgi:hypothetical protein